MLLTLSIHHIFNDYFHPIHDLQSTRIGHVTSSSAKIFIRIKIDDPVKLAFKEKGSVRWIDTTPITLTEESDYTSVFELDDLHPSTRYEYAWFVGEKRIKFASTDLLEFKTFPKDDETVDLVFAYGSCVKTGFPYLSKVINVLFLN